MDSVPLDDGLRVRFGGGSAVSRPITPALTFFFAFPMLYHPVLRSIARHITYRDGSHLRSRPQKEARRWPPEAAVDAREYVFHPSQAMVDLPGGSLIVRFRAGHRA
jgi:hypothetical protein